MARDIIAALDVGTSTVQTVVAERERGGNGVTLLGVGVAPSAGIRRGMVVDLEDATRAIQQSLAEASRAAGVPIRSVWLAVGGAHISVSSSRGVVAVSRADGEISPEDVRRAIAAAESFIPKHPNREVLHIIPRDFKVDSESGVKDPVGMHGFRLEADTLIIECATPSLKNLLKAVEASGVRVEDYVFGALAASEAVLSKRQKELGAMLLDIGGGTASFMVFEDGAPLHAGVLPIGGNHITNDVAIGFRTQVDIADHVKLAYGTCLPADVSKKDGMIRFDDLPFDMGVHVGTAEWREEGKKQNRVESAGYSRRSLAEIIEARLQDLFELLQKELKRVNRVALLPAGVVLVGGSSALPGLLDLTKQEMKLPVSRGTLDHSPILINEERAPSFVTAVGVLQWAAEKGGESSRFGAWRLPKWANFSWLKWFQSFLP